MITFGAKPTRGAVLLRAGLAALLALGLAGCGSDRPAPHRRVTPAGTRSPSASASPSPAPVVVPGTTVAGTVPPVIEHGPATGKRIALTFDSNMTDAMLRWLDSGRVQTYASPKVIDELQRAHVPATFFLASKWVQRYPDLTRRIAADPNFELASHSYAHLGFTARCYDLGSIPPDQMATDVEQSFQVLKPYGGHQTRYFRFPGGCYDQAALRAIAPAGCTAVEYDVVGGDPFNHDPDAISRAVLSQAHPGGIVVLHVTGDNAPMTDRALPGIISGLQQQGYQLVTLSALLGQDAGGSGVAVSPAPSGHA